MDRRAFMGEVEAPERIKVTFTHNMPDDAKYGLPDDMKANCMFTFKFIPEPESQPGKVGVLYYNPTNDSFWYEYIDRPLTPEEEIKQLKDNQVLMQKAIDDIILGGGTL